MFWFRETTDRLEVAFTDREGGVSVGEWSSLDLGGAGRTGAEDVRTNHDLLATAVGVDALRPMSQVHGAAVGHVAGAPGGDVPECDALVSCEPGAALLVRVADCVPVLLADVDAGVVGAVHAGRAGLVAGVVPAALAELHGRGARRLTAWVGPRACGSCYELPEQMADDVEAAVPGTRSVTSWGTPAVDVGAGVVAQLLAADVDVRDVGAQACTIESEDLFSYRRQGARSGRLGGVVVLR